MRNLLNIGKFPPEGDQEREEDHEREVLNERILSVHHEAEDGKQQDEQAHVLRRMSERLRTPIGVDFPGLIVGEHSLIVLEAEPVP